jgi:hypothetical protein
MPLAVGPKGLPTASKARQTRPESSVGSATPMLNGSSQTLSRSTNLPVEPGIWTMSPTCWPG